MSCRQTTFTTLLSTVLLLSAVACDPVVPGEGEGEGEKVAERDIGRALGGTSFLSADGQAGQTSPDERSGGEGEGEGEAPASDSDAEAGAGSDDGTRTVEEGDIYRVLGDGLIANLNAYRGLQLIDVSDVSAPAVVGRLQISGHPVEMYVAGDRAFILMNNWYGYYGVRDDLASLGQMNGGVVVSVDISDPTSPVLLDQAFVPGYISKSRLTRGNVSAALYVAASRYDSFENDDGTWSYQTRTTVKSFDVASGAIVEKTELDLGGYVTDIQATPEALIVARYDWSYDPVTGYDNGSYVSLIDISSPDGTMVEGDQVEVAGYVQNQFRMDLYNDVLRVASGSMWGGGNTNHIQTFDASDLSSLVLLDEATYGDGEQLFATLFLENKAFAVTYLRVDPFHAFSIADDGTITEESEFVVSGWNDFFKPAFDDTRLIGIGINDEQGRSMSVSLYDITDLTNANPLLARAEVEADYSWSEASWDHRAFSVIQGAANATGPNGEAETGLVLLPFSGWSEGNNGYTAAVQIFTFSPSSLTRRGLMVHGTPVRRSFEADDGLTANLSEAELSLFGTSDPASPVEHGRVELAPNYADVLLFGDYAARVNRKSDYYSGWYAGSEPPSSVVELIPASAHPDNAVAVSSVLVPANAQLYAVGDQLVAVTTTVTDWSSYPYETETRVRTFDLSDPTVPVAAGELVTDRLASSGGYYYGYDDCWDCGYYGYYGPSADVAPVNGGLAFLQRHHEQELLGTEQVCSTWGNEPSTCTDTDGVTSCTYLEGGKTCRQLEGEDEATCYGSFRRCTYSYDDNEYEYECVDVDESTVETTTSCWENERYRYWTRFTVEVLDLRSPESPALLDTITLPEQDEGVRMVQDGSRVWISYKRPEDAPGTSLPYVRYFAKKLDLTNLSNPTLGNGVNVPGELLAVSGNTLYTRDYVWGDEIVETTLNRVTVSGGLGYLDAIHGFDDQIVSQVSLDGAGNALVMHRLAWQFIETQEDYATRLTVLDAGGDMSALSTTLVDTWAQLKDARQGRALFQVPGGLLVMNLDDASAPYAQAFFALRGWPSRIHVEGSDVVVPAGRYGIYRFDLGEFNLLAPPM